MAEHVLESAGHGLERVLSPAARWAFRVAMLVMALMMIPVFVDVILRFPLLLFPSLPWPAFRKQRGTSTSRL